MRRESRASVEQDGRVALKICMAGHATPELIQSKAGIVGIVNSED